MSKYIAEITVYRLFLPQKLRHLLIAFSRQTVYNALRMTEDQTKGIGAMKKNLFCVLFSLLALTFLLCSCSPGDQFSAGIPGAPGKLNFENGMAQPLLEYSGPEKDNKYSQILRFCVYVETDHDTDADGKADLVKAFVQVPRAAATGGFKAAAIYDPTPYPAGMNYYTSGADSYTYSAGSFDYDELYKPGKKRTPKRAISTLVLASQADPEDWNYMMPASPETEAYYTKRNYDYFLIRGFAVVDACGIGTYGSEGYELCGRDLERDSHKCVVEWLTGDRPAYTDKEGTTTIKADWCNGSVAMTGASYGGTLPYEVATTGVKGLKTIIPVAALTNWYDYTNSQGVSIYSKPCYTDYLADFNSGATFLDDDWTVQNDRYISWLKQIAADETKANGNYTDIWAEADYSQDTENIRCSALIIHGLNDFNVMTKEFDLMFRAFTKAGQNVKMILHQDGHSTIFGKKIGSTLYEDLLNKWLSHYLYGIDNGIEDMAALTVQSNVDGSFRTCSSWNDLKYLPAHAHAKAGSTALINNGKFDDFYENYLCGQPFEDYYRDVMRDEDLSVVYDLDVPEGAVIRGVPKVRMRLSTDDVSRDGLMVSGVLIDTAENGKAFPAYLIDKQLENRVAKKTVDKYIIGPGHKYGQITQLVQSPTDIKAFSFGYMDLMDPEAGYIPSENREHAPIEADTFYDYTLYLSPTVYTLAKGHHLQLLLLAQDPHRSRWDDTEDATPGFSDDTVDPVYSFTVDNDSIDVQLPLEK